MLKMRGQRQYMKKTGRTVTYISRICAALVNEQARGVGSILYYKHIICDALFRNREFPVHENRMYANREKMQVPVYIYRNCCG